MKLVKASHVPFACAGTSLLYIPGILEGGTLEHYCSLQGSIGYLLEPLLMLAPFAKHQIRITLHGITNGTVDTSVSEKLKCVVIQSIVYLCALVCEGWEGPQWQLFAVAAVDARLIDIVLHQICKE